MEGMETLSANKWMFHPDDVCPALPLALAHVLATCPHPALSSLSAAGHSRSPRPPKHCLSGTWLLTPFSWAGHLDWGDGKEGPGGLFALTQRPDSPTADEFA